MSIVTKGLGGCGLITKGFGWLRKLIKIIKRVLIPEKRKRIKKRLRVLGNTLHSFKEKVLVAGNPEVEFRKRLRVSGTKYSSFSSSYSVKGNPSVSFKTVSRIKGSISKPINLHTRILGNLSKPVKVELSCKGKKDFRQILWEILEDEEELK